MEPPAELVRDSADLAAVSIPYLRRLVHTTLADLFATQTTDIGSEMWRYEGQLEGVKIKLDIQRCGPGHGTFVRIAQSLF
jgi:hypothetical protein